MGSVKLFVKSWACVGRPCALTHNKLEQLQYCAFLYLIKADFENNDCT